MADTFVQLVGNLTDDPEVRFTPAGTQVGSFRLAVTPRVREGEGWKNGETSYFTITCWRDLASHTAESLSKGDRALVIGRLKTRTWETPEGERRSVVEVEADEIGPSQRQSLTAILPDRLHRTHSCGNAWSKWGGCSFFPGTT